MVPNHLSGRLLQFADVVAATVQKRQNGAVVPMASGLCVTPAACVGLPTSE